MSILWTDEGRLPPKGEGDTAPSFSKRARDRRVAALTTLARRRSTGETDLIAHARRRHMRQLRKLKLIG